MMESLSPLSPETLPAAGPFALPMLQPFVSGLQAVNDNDEPEPPPAAAAPLTRIGAALLFDISRMFAPAFSGAAA